MSFIETLHGGEFIIAELGALSRDSALVVADRQLAAGTVVALDGDGHLDAYTGSGACAGILLYPVDTRDGSKAAAYIARRARVRFDLLTVPEGFDATTAAALEANTIVVSSDSVLVDTGGGGEGYVQKWAHFDGANSSLLNANPTATDVRNALYSIWFNVSVGGFVFLQNPDSPSGYNNFYIGGGNDNDGLTFEATNAVGDKYLTVSDRDGNGDPSVPCPYGIPHHAVVGFAVDFASGSKIGKLYLDGVPVTDFTSDAFSAFDIGFNGIPFYIGDVFGGSGFTGDLADLFIISSASSFFDENGDISVATRELFRSAAGNPVDPAIAVAALGSPLVLCSGEGAVFGDNQGTCGPFVLTGTL